MVRARGDRTRLGQYYNGWHSNLNQQQVAGGKTIPEAITCKVIIFLFIKEKQSV